MAQAGTLDGNTLAWVKSEIDTTIDNARQALEAYVETPDDESQLRFCLNYLHQVYGTLQMVELYGAGMLAQEMEGLTQALLDNKVKNRDDAFEVMMKGMMQLPDYLEKLQQGQHDYPIVLLPLLNDLRASRSAALLSESALFSPDLEVDAPIPLESAEDSIQTLARKLRHAYHLGLLDWFRDNNVKAGLKRISAVIEKLRPAANDPDTSRVLWAASGVAEALRDQGIESSVATKLLLGQLDREFKKIIDNGEFALSSEPPVDLLKNFLYYIASSRSVGNRVNELKEAFKLEGLVPDTETLERARADLSAPNAALMRTVSSVLLEDLTQVKDSLDVFVRAEDRDPTVLIQLCEKLTKMGDTLDMLGFGAQRMLLQEQISILQAMGSGEREVDETVLMDVAGALLNIESALTEPASQVVESTRTTEEQEVEASIIRQFGDPDKRKLVKRVVDEVKVDLGTIKDAFNDYSRAPKHIEVLNNVPELLDRIRGSLSMLTLNRAADILGSAAYYVQTKILKDAVRPDPRSLDLLADSISSVEYYLESITDSWGHPTSILDVAEQSLNELGVTPGQIPSEDELVAETENESDETHSEIEASALNLYEGDDDQTLVDINFKEDESTAELSLEISSPEIKVSDSEQADNTELGSGELSLEGFDVAEEIAQDEADATFTDLGDEVPDSASDIDIGLYDRNKPESKPVQEPVTKQAPPAPVVTTPQPVGTIADELDDEIVEIFLEEAEEEHANISRLLPHWQNNQSDEETLKNLRRSFHTLKGSGRLVGAVDVGEFAWSFEQMLNRVIDKTVIPSEDMFDLLNHAKNALPGLLELFRDGKKPGQDVFNLMSLAEALRKGEPIDLASVDSAPQIAIEPEPGINETTAEIPFDYDAMSAERADLQPVESAEIEIDTDSEDILSTDESIELSVPDLNLEEDLTDQATAGSDNIDPVLLDIYRKEIETHLLALKEYLDDWHANKDRSANHKLLRALHTLKGSSRTASVNRVAELCNFLEDHVKFLQDNELDVSNQLADLLEDSGGFIEEIVQQLDQEDAIMPDNAALVVRARELLNGTRSETPTTQIQLDDSMSDLQEIPQEEFNLDDQLASGEIDLDISAPEIEIPDTVTEQRVTPAADYDEELLEIFLEEGVEILDESDHTLADWIESPENGDHVKALQRQLHTLKGGARMAGVIEVGDLSHSIETMLTGLVDRRLDVTDDMFKVLQKAQDKLVGMLETVRSGKHPEAAIELIKAMDALGRGETIDEMDLESATSSDTIEAASLPEEPSIPEIEISLDAEQENLPELEITAEPEEIDLSTGFEEPETHDNVVPLTTQAPTEVEETVPAKQVADDQKQEQRTRAELIRVRAELLDNLVNFAGEVSIYRSRMEQQTNAFRYNLTELDDTVNRLRGQLRQFEIEAEAQIQYRTEEEGRTQADFDPLEFDRFTQMQTLSRGMMESLNDLDSLRGILTNLTRESETLLLQQSRVNTELQEGLMRTRMVPISGQVPRLRRIVRQTSEELAKKVELHIHGADNELDRTILERVMSPIEHMLRNAIAHGLETPEKRVAVGKNETGNVHLGFNREGSDIVITVSDDGAGINTDAIRKKAIERGLIRADAKVSKEDLLDMILQSGFSTAEEVTQISGRGVGMDVVDNEIKQLGGILSIDTEKNQGTTFSISMPMSLSVTRALMVTVGEEQYAIPLLGVESVERVTRDEIIRMQSDAKGAYNWLENDYQYIHLGAAMGMSEVTAPPEEQTKLPILLVRSGEHRAAIHVDGLIGSREVVVKPVGPQLSTLRGIAGATIMGDGSVVLIMDLGVLIRLTSIAREEGGVAAEVTPVVVEKRIPLIMVVDDSITVRKVTTRLLERNNFKTVSAKDGVDALAQLQEIRPDVMLLDVEMPRMDGFELATNIRNDDVLKNLPIIMITSRTGQKHRDRAMNIGVNVYMGKPYSEGELLDNINNMLNQGD